MSKEMGESSLQGDMIRMPLPHGGFAVYPSKFAYDAIRKQKFSIFVAKGITKQDPSVLMATHVTGSKAILFGPYDQLRQRLFDIPWKENIIISSNDQFFRKIAPSLQALDEVIEALTSSGGKV
ncbi:hypothetical protein [Paenibacillus campinasensis]|uniref:Uncharacterized protein n=1 Tax=Paenibacillus campinasensis TaxID=66347 RepID=A0A268EIA0_9BACL|nr:hypothetical protein [Paenibacillus campinasensis]PAD72851.1 hypothetical protein CHH67_21325 [Paenibacillus campinasensis]